MKSTLTRTLTKVALRLWLPVLLVVVWWIGSANSQSIYFPPLQDIMTTFRQDWLFARFGSDLAPSLTRFALGFLIASVGGIVIGTLLGLNPRAKRATEPIIQFLRAIPPPALLPVALLFFGISSKMNVAIIVIGAIWPTLLNTADGVRSVDPQLGDFSRSYRLSFSERLFRVTLPSASPQIFAGLRTTLQLSIVLIVVSEMIGAVNGVGFYVLNAQQTFAIRQTWAGTIVLGLLGYVSTLIFLQVEKRALTWQRGMQHSAEGV